MLKLFEREIANVSRRLAILAPAHTAIPTSFINVNVDADEHKELKEEVQRFRGGIYLRDGALRRDQLTGDGRHETSEDDRAWHLVLRGDDGGITGCIWYLEHEQSPRFEQLRVQHSPLWTSKDWRTKLRSAVSTEVARARKEQIRYAEVGGWAVACHKQCTSAALMLILGTYSLSQLAGGALVMATATVRNSSAKILRRLGGSYFETNGESIPPYYDPRYECEMELLRFDTRRPAPKYAGLVSMLTTNLAEARVLANEDLHSRIDSVNIVTPLAALAAS